MLGLVTTLRHCSILTMKQDGEVSESNGYFKEERDFHDSTLSNAKCQDSSSVNSKVIFCHRAHTYDCTHFASSPDVSTVESAVKFDSSDVRLNSLFRRLADGALLVKASRGHSCFCR